MTNESMQVETPQPPAPEAEIKTTPRDLRAELMTNLESQFAAKLNESETLPNAVRESLVALLSANGQTSANVIAALALEDPIALEVPSE